jgi:ATP-binding cassette subfamily B protein
MGNPTFTRALRFLNYNPVAKWLALTGAVGTGILYVALLVVLGLFADLMAERGEIPCWANLSERNRAVFLEGLSLSSAEKQGPKATPDAGERGRSAGDDGIRREVENLGVTDPEALGLATAQAKANEELRLELSWFARLVPFLRESVSDDAAEQVRDALRRNVANWGLPVALNHNLKDFGVLGLVVRSRSSLSGTLLGWVVPWNGWMWVEGNAYYLEGLFAVAVGLALLRAVLMHLSSYMAAVATVVAATRLRRAIYHQTYRLGTLAFRALGPSEAVGVSTRHLEAVHDALYGWLTVVFREPIKFGLLLVFAMLVNPPTSFWLALAFLLFALLVWLIGGQIAAYYRRQGRAVSHRAADQLALIQESLMLMRLVKVYLMELFNQARVERQLAKYSAAQLRRYRGEATYRPLFMFLALVAALGLLLLAGMVVLQGRLGFTSAMIQVTALVSLYWPLETWLEHRRFQRRGRESAVVLFNFLDRPGGVGQVIDAEFLPAMSKQLEFDEVSLQEPGTGRKLLQGVNFSIQAGQRVALIGPEDMEKHALVYLIPRFLDPTSGEIRIDRKNLRWVTLDSLRTQIAIVLQHNLVFNDTVANNIGCGDPSYNLPQIIEAAKVAHAHQFIQKLPQGYETHIGEMGHSLRSSEQFRIALARAILRDPALLIIEEPTIALDEDTKSLLDDTYARVLPGRTAIFLPHRLSTIRSCDRVFLLYNGKIEATGDHRELLAQNELYRHLQYLEFNEFAGVISGPMPAASGSTPPL